MLSKCANPDCDALFHYLRDGRLFQLELGGGPHLVGDPRPQRKIEYFWLCSRCAPNMTLTYVPGTGVVSVVTAVRRAVAS